MANEINSKSPLRYPIQHIDVFTGTTSRCLATIERALVHENGYIALPDLAGTTVVFDYECHPPVDVASQLDVDADDLFGPHEFVAAVLPMDPESLNKAEANGIFSLLPEGWYRQLGASLTNLGATGDQRLGYTLAVLSDSAFRTRLGKCLGHCVKHDRPGQRLLKGFDAEDESAHLVAVNFYGTAVGGMAGSIFHFLTNVKTDALNYGIRAKTVVHLLLAGDLPVNRDQRINQVNLLKTLRAYASGEYDDPVSGQIQERPDILFLQSDQNGHGSLSSLERFISHEAHCQNALWNSPSSIQIHERLVDIENRSFDEYGDPLVGFTISSSDIHRDNKKIAAHHSNMAASLLAEALVSGAQPARANQEALALARMDGVLESEEDCQLTGSLLAPEEFKGESLVQHLRSSVSDSIEGTTGMERANAMAERLNTISSTDFPVVFQPAMNQQAEKILRQAIDRLNLCIRQSLSGHSGSDKYEKCYLGVLSVLLSYRRLIQASREAVTEKISQIQQFGQPHQTAANSALEQLQQVREYSWFRRLFHLFLPGRIADCLETSGRVYLESQLQVLACQIAIDAVLDKLIDFLDGKLSELGMLKQNLKQVFASCKQQAERWASKPTTLDTPLGFDLVTKVYLDESFNRIAAETGGKEGLVNHLFTRFLSKYRSFSCLLGKSPDEIEQALKQTCQAYFKPIIEQTDVVAEFKRLYPDRNRQLRFVRRLVLQSEGSILTAGESGRDIVWQKFVTVPSSDYRDWAGDLVEKVDRKPGKWQVIIDNRTDVISVIQLRGTVSLTPIIARQDLPEPQGWEEMVARAIDRVTAMMPPPNPNDRQLRRIFAKAVITSQLLYDDVAGFSLTFSSKEPIRLGKQPRAAGEKLRRRWDWIVHIESTFGHQVVRDDKEVAKRIDQLEIDRNSAQAHADPRFGLIDDTAISDLKKQMDLLKSWALRLRVNVKRTDK